MFAIVEINDKQHLIEEGDILTIDGLIEVKNTTFGQVLMLQDETKIEFGEPFLKNVSVEFEVIEAGKREKDIVFKFKRKTGYKLTKGHRQNSTLLKVKKIITKKNSSKSAEVSPDKGE